MPYSFACSYGTKLSVGENLLGKAVKCPKCATVLKVPAAGAATSTAVAAPPAPKAPAAPPVSTPTPRLELPPSAAKPAGSKQVPAITPKPAPPKPAAQKPPVPRPAPKAAPKPPPAPVLDDVEVVDDVEEVAPARPAPARKGPPPLTVGLTAAPPPPPGVEEAPLEEVEEVGGVDYAGVGRRVADIARPSLDEDFPVPEHLQEQVREELSKGERVVWVGQPSRRIILIRTIPTMIMTGLMALFIGGFFLIHALTTKGAGMGGLVTGLLILLIMGAVTIFQPIYTLWKAKRTCYVLTNRRCIVWLCQWHGGVRTDNYTPAQLTNLRRADMWFFAKGGGDLIFRSVTVITTTYSRRGGSSTSMREYRYGFLAIERCRDVEKLVRETLLDRFLDKLND